MRLGRFELLSEFARGGMGIVYRARDTGSGNEVLVKTLLNDTLQASERLTREIEVLSRLHHPGVVSILDGGWHEGRPWYAMQRVEGESLGERLRRGPLPMDSVQRLAEDLAASLEALHAAGVIHRDLTPDNVIATDDGRFVLIDFGLTKDLERHDSLTRTGAWIGTPGYCSPEQLGGAQSTPSCDLYGFGATVYAALVGEAPFGGSTLVEIAAATLRAELIPPSRARPDVPPVLEGVVLRCLNRLPTARFASASALKEALHASPPAPAGPSPLLLATGLGLTALLVGLTWLALTPATPPATAQSPTPAPSATQPRAEPATSAPADLVARLQAGGRDARTRLAALQLLRFDPQHALAGRARRLLRASRPLLELPKPGLHEVAFVGKRWLLAVSIPGHLLRLDLHAEVPAWREVPSPGQFDSLGVRGQEVFTLSRGNPLTRFKLPLGPLPPFTERPRRSPFRTNLTLAPSGRWALATRGRLLDLYDLHDDQGSPRTTLSFDRKVSKHRIRCTGLSFLDPRTLVAGVDETFTEGEATLPYEGRLRLLSLSAEGSLSMGRALPIGASLAQLMVGETTALALTRDGRLLRIQALREQTPRLTVLTSMTLGNSIHALAWQERSARLWVAIDLRGEKQTQLGYWPLRDGVLGELTLLGPVSPPTGLWLSEDESLLVVASSRQPSSVWAADQPSFARPRSE